MHSNDETTIRMANQIAAFFHSYEKEEAMKGIAEHINKFWEPRMRTHFFAVIDSGGKGFDPLVREAARLIRRPAQKAAA